MFLIQQNGEQKVSIKQGKDIQCYQIQANYKNFNHEE